jgi:hypothetical protein
MSIRSQVKKEGEYPQKIGIKQYLEIDNHTIIVTTYETEYGINIYLGGEKHWCIHCELIKKDNKIKENGYLIKIRYDMLCSKEETIKHGGDITKLLKLLIKYIYNTYPIVKYLFFNDLSTRRCDNGYDTNLAVMTYLYTEKTWYEKNFGATIAPQSKEILDKIITELNKSKTLSWDIVKDTIYNYKELPYNEYELELIYNNAKTWKLFFEKIEQKISIKYFCIFISTWLDTFILKYFNNLMGLTYRIPINISYISDISYIKKEYSGGRYKSYFKGARKNKTIKRFNEME